MGGGLISVQDKTVSVVRNWKPEFPSGRLADALTYLGVGVVFPACGVTDTDTQGTDSQGTHTCADSRCLDGTITMTNPLPFCLHMFSESFPTNGLLLPVKEQLPL